VKNREKQQGVNNKKTSNCCEQVTAVTSVINTQKADNVQNNNVIGQKI